MEHIVKGKKRVYTVSEIEEILGVSEMTVYRLVRKICSEVFVSVVQSGFRRILLTSG
jgi:DNA-directed RNA polymerase specialized sigma subunit